jgi:cbb3-type cytochrome oxidase subunit 3
MLFVLASWLLIITPTEVLGQGCAMCQTVMPRGDDPLARGMFWSVLLLMTMPFVIGSSIGGWIFYRYRKASRAQRATAAVLPLNLSTTLKEGQP